MKKLKAVIRNKSKRESVIDSPASASSSNLALTLSSHSDLLSREPFPDGIKVLYDGQDAAVDICFIHGLTGNRDSTWTAHGQAHPWPQTLLPQRIPQSRILTYGYDAYITLRPGTSVSSNGLFDHASNFLNDLTTNRAVCGASGRPLIFVAHSLGGLVCKETILSSKNPTEPHLKDIFKATKGIIFMGTPHAGSWMADWAKLPAKALGIVKSTNQSLLKVLRSSDQYLESVQLRFLTMIRDLQQSDRRIEITCFYEELPLPVVGKVVSKESATFAGYNMTSIHANHRDMVRFSNGNETGFQRLLGELVRWVAEIRDANISQKPQAREFLSPSPQPRASASSLGKHHSYSTISIFQKDDESDLGRPLPAEVRHHGLSRPALVMATRLFDLADDDRSLLAVDRCLDALKLDQHIERLASTYHRDGEWTNRQSLETEIKATYRDACTRCLKSLSFSEMGAREASIEHPVRDTCQWIYGTAAYASWNSKSSNILWIKGKPGSGKSTLMKSFCARRSKTGAASSTLFLPFFFNGRGALTERSPTGLYFTLMSNLLRKSRIFMCEFLPIFMAQENRSSSGNVNWQWSDIQRHFHSIIVQKQSSGIEIAIDALDECEEEEVRIIIRQFERSIDLARQSGVTLSVCWSSRHYPTISMLSQYGIEVTMDDNNASDIVQFVKLELPTYLDPLLSEIQDKIILRANGVFLWAVLVSKKMLKAVDQGKNEQQLHELLESIPFELDDLFDDIFKQIDSASLERKELICVAQWILCAFRPLTLNELYTALGSQTSKTSWSSRPGPPTDGDLHRLRRWVNDVSGGLFEVVGSSNNSNRVQVIHETVREYFLSPKGCVRLLTPSRELFLEDGNKELAIACFQFFLGQENDLTQASDKQASSAEHRLLDSLAGPFAPPIELPSDFYIQTYAFKHFENVRKLFCSKGPLEHTPLHSTELRRRALMNYLRLCLDQSASEQSLPAKFTNNMYAVARALTAFDISMTEFIRLMTALTNLCVSSALLRDRALSLPSNRQSHEAVEKFHPDGIIAVFCVFPYADLGFGALLKYYLENTDAQNKGKDKLLQMLGATQLSVVFAMRLMLSARSGMVEALENLFFPSISLNHGISAERWEFLHELNTIGWDPTHQNLWDTLQHNEYHNFPEPAPVCILFREKRTVLAEMSAQKSQEPLEPVNDDSQVGSTLEDTKSRASDTRAVFVACALERTMAPTGWFKSKDMSSEDLSIPSDDDLGSWLAERNAATSKFQKFQKTNEFFRLTRLAEQYEVGRTMHSRSSS